MNKESGIDKQKNSVKIFIQNCSHSAIGRCHRVGSNMIEDSELKKNLDESVIEYVENRSLPKTIIKPMQEVFKTLFFFIDYGGVFNSSIFHRQFKLYKDVSKLLNNFSADDIFEVEIKFRNSGKMSILNLSREQFTIYDEFFDLIEDEYKSLSKMVERESSGIQLIEGRDEQKINEVVGAACNGLNSFYKCFNISSRYKLIADSISIILGELLEVRNYELDHLKVKRLIFNHLKGK